MDEVGLEVDGGPSGCFTLYGGKRETEVFNNINTQRPGFLLKHQVSLLLTPCPSGSLCQKR